MQPGPRLVSAARRCTASWQHCHRQAAAPPHHACSARPPAGTTNSSPTCGVVKKARRPWKGAPILVSPRKKRKSSSRMSPPCRHRRERVEGREQAGKRQVLVSHPGREQMSRAHGCCLPNGTEQAAAAGSRGKQVRKRNSKVAAAGGSSRAHTKAVAAPAAASAGAP